MAQLKRSEIITQARIDAGRAAEAITLTKEFDFITLDMSKQANLLAENVTGNIVAAQNYIGLPALYKSMRLLDVGGRYRRRYSNFKVGDNWLRRLPEADDFYYLDQTQTGTPTLYMIEASPSIYRAYLYPMTATETPAYTFHYWKLHEKAWPTWAGLSGKTDIFFTAPQFITSGSSGFVLDACRIGRKITITGSASNDGTYTIASATTMLIGVSETTIVNEAAGASVTVAVETEDNYLHQYGENYDDVVIAGVAWKAAKKIKERAVESDLYGIYQDKLADMAMLVNKSAGGRTHYHHF